MLLKNCKLNDFFSLFSDDLQFAQVYRFIGDIFDPDSPCPVETHLQKLKSMDDIIVKTVSTAILAF